MTATEHEAVVLRALRYGEADVIVHLYTRLDGRRNAIAKGARKARSRLGGRVEPFTAVRLQLRSGRTDLAIVQSVELLDAHEQLRVSYALQQVAAAALDMLGRLSVEHAANESAYHLARNFLRLLEGTDGTHAGALLLGFQLKLLHVSGLAPQLGSCARCGGDESLTWFSGADGGAVCDACSGAGDAAVEPHVLDAARWAMQVPLAAIATADPLPDPSGLQGASRQLVASMCAEHAGFRPRTA